MMLTADHEAASGAKVEKGDEPGSEVKLGRKLIQLYIHPQTC